VRLVDVTGHRLGEHLEAAQRTRYRRIAYLHGDIANESAHRCGDIGTGPRRFHGGGQQIGIEAKHLYDRDLGLKQRLATNAGRLTVRSFKRHNAYAHEVLEGLGELERLDEAAANLHVELLHHRRAVQIVVAAPALV
jgi:hypothetical protein